MKKLCILFVLSVTFRVASGQLLNVEQEVFGMDCAPCAYGLERGLKKLEGLESVRVSLNDGKAYLALAPANTLTLKKIQEQVKSNGFSARNAVVTLSGTLTKSGNDFVLTLNGETFQITSDTDSKIISALNPGEVKVRGTVLDVVDKNIDGRWRITTLEIIN